MPNRIWVRTSTIFATVLAGAVVMAATCGAVRAADDCLGAPKSQTPPGGHWYYRVDHSSHRKCWYLGDDGQKVSQVASPRPSSSDTDPSPRTAADVQQSTADAHAELPSAKPPAERSSELRAAVAAKSKPETRPEIVSEAAVGDGAQPLPASPGLRDPSGPDRTSDDATRVTSDGAADQLSAMDARIVAPGGAVGRVAAVAPAAEEASSLRTMLALLLIALGLTIIVGYLVFRPSSEVQVERRDMFSRR